MGSLDHVCGTTMPTVDLNKQSPGRMAQQNEEICKKGTPNLREVLERFQREQAATEVTVQQLFFFFFFFSVKLINIIRMKVQSVP